MSLFSAITWSVSPEIVNIFGFELRWYGLCFAIAFLLGYYLLKKIFVAEKLPIEWMDKVFYYVMIATIVGARLGHVFFYDWDYYSQNLVEIVMIRKGGLASHGALIGVLIALWLYSKKVSKKPMTWILDRVAIVAAPGAFFVRMGNLMNHEIVGEPTDVAWAFIFTKGIDMQPRHPAQLYEAIAYLMMFLLLWTLFWKTKVKEKSGFLFGVYLITFFGARFIIEYVKESQGGFESVLGDALSTGQWLSIPFLLAGVYLMVTAKDKTQQTMS